MSSDVDPKAGEPADKSAEGGEAPKGSQDYPIFLALLLVGVFIVLVFRGVGGYGYVYDDKTNVISNSHLYPMSWENLKYYWSEPYASLYVPVTYTVLSFEAQLAAQTDQETGRVALNPAVFHYGNLVLHMANAMLVVILLRAVFGHTLAAMAGGLLFALHPLQVETVSWITETKGLLATLFGLLAIWQYWLYAAGGRHPLANHPQDSVGAHASSGGWWHYALATLVFCLAMLSKPSAVTIPLVILLLDAGLLRRGWLSTLVPIIPWFCLSLAVVAITRGEQTIEQIQDVVPAIYRPVIAADALSFYIQKVMVPWGLVVDYGRQPSYVLLQWWVYVTWLVPVILIGLLLLHRERRTLLVFMGVFVAALLPMLGLIPFGFQGISTVADRYAYFAMLGPAMAISWVVERYSRPALIGVMAGVLLCLGAMSYIQTSYWHNTQTLFEHVLTVNERSATANLSLGNLLANTDRDAAVLYYWAAVDAAPNDAGANASLGTLLFAMGDLREAIAHLRASLEIRPDNYLAQFYLAQALAARGDYAGARDHFEQTLRYNPHVTDATIQLAWLLATCPDDEVRNGSKAIELLKPHVKENEPSNPMAVDAMAAAQADMREFDLASQTAEKLLLQLKQLAKSDSQWIPYLNAVQARAELYGEKQPYRGGPTRQLVPLRAM